MPSSSILCADVLVISSATSGSMRCVVEDVRMVVDDVHAAAFAFEMACVCIRLYGSKKCKIVAGSVLVHLLYRHVSYLLYIGSMLWMSDSIKFYRQESFLEWVLTGCPPPSFTFSDSV